MSAYKFLDLISVQLQFTVMHEEGKNLKSGVCQGATKNQVALLDFP